MNESILDYEQYNIPGHVQGPGVPLESASAKKSENTERSRLSNSPHLHVEFSTVPAAG
jgi:hypothetical protein